MDETGIIQDCDETIRPPALKKEIKRNRINRRIWEIDLLRGLAVILMIFDHIMFDFDFFGDAWALHLDPSGWFYRMSMLAADYWVWGVREVVRNIVVCIFFITSGISSTFSRSNLKRGILIAAVAAVITVVTATIDRIADAGLLIRFGVLHCFAVCILFYAAFDLLLKLVKQKWIRIAVLAAVAAGVVAGGIYLAYHPVIAEHNWFEMFGIVSKDYYSSDYFPLLPWLGVFLIGTILGKTVYRKRKTLLAVLDRGWCKPLKFVGRHALILYVAHQVMIFAIFYVTGKALGYN